MQLREDLLLNAKAMTPLPESAGTELVRIENLDIAGYSEADVREEIISPLLRLLGYAKETNFSVDREKNIKILEKNLFIDYNLTLWKENFWLIEAKKPRTKNPKPFRHKDLVQALAYAAHPEINAVLIVLCDGHVIEVFDRESSLSEPLLRVERQHLSRNINKLRALLEPWQIMVL